MTRPLISIAAILVLVFVSFDARAEIPNQSKPLENVMVGGQPQISDLEALAAAGYKLVINLRKDGEFDGYDEAQLVADLGMVYVSIPVDGLSGVTKEAAERLHEVLSSADGQVLLHCASGMRASGLLALEEYFFSDLSLEQASELASIASVDRLKADRMAEIIESVEGS